MSILVFRTSLQDEKDVQAIATILDVNKEICSWNVDFEDWENILRIEILNDSLTNEIAAGIKSLGYQCEELED